MKQQIECIETFLHILRYFETDHKPLEMRHLMTEEDMKQQNVKWVKIESKLETTRYNFKTKIIIWNQTWDSGFGQ